MSATITRIALLCVLLTSCAFAQAWDGWYAGAHGGYLDGKLTASDESHFDTTGEFDDDSPIAGLHVGRCRTLDSGWVLGYELVLPLYIQKGTAVDTEFFPDADPRVIYEADYKWALILGGRLGKPMGNWLVYGCGAVGLASVTGKTINLDDQNVYTVGAEQSADATHLVYRIGAGADVPVGETMFAGLRVMAFNSNQKSYEMPWNEGEDNSFGLNALLVQAHMSRWF